MIDIEKARDDYKTVIRWWREVESWPEDDLKVVEVGIQAAMKGSDENLKTCWANHLAGEAERIRREKAMRGSAWPH